MKKILLLLVLDCTFLYAQESSTTNNLPLDQRPKKVLVVSGGGARGAWGAGVVTALAQRSNYVCVVGTSTGSLMAPLVALEKYDSLKIAYTTQTQKDIFSVNPFKPDGNIRGFNAFWRFITGKRTLGESKKLRNLIKQYFSYQDYRKLKKQGKTVIVNVVNLTTDSLESHSTDDNNDYEDFKNWMWASGNEPVLMSLYGKKINHKKNYFVDGGVRRVIPLPEAVNYAIKNHIRDIDVIINAPLQDTTKTKCTKTSYSPNILGSIMQTLDISLSEVKLENIKIGLDSAKTEDSLRVRIVAMPPSLYCKCKNELIFNKDTMQILWDGGYSQGIALINNAAFEKNAVVNSTILPTQSSSPLQKGEAIILRKTGKKSKIQVIKD